MPYRKMRSRLAALVVVVVASLTAAGSALAFDCIRVSSSLQGLQESTQSGNWLLIDVSSAEAVQRTFETVGEAVPSDAQAECFASAYAASGQPAYFAVGIGVAGPNGVLAHRNTNTMGDGRGVDQLEASGILLAFFDAALACGIDVSE
jgi:hypothetical protein